MVKVKDEGEAHPSASLRRSPQLPVAANFPSEPPINTSPTSLAQPHNLRSPLENQG